jgi:hypothetical protein
MGEMKTNMSSRQNGSCVMSSAERLSSNSRAASCLRGQVRAGEGGMMEHRRERCATSSGADDVEDGVTKELQILWTCGNNTLIPARQMLSVGDGEMFPVDLWAAAAVRGLGTKPRGLPLETSGYRVLGLSSITTHAQARLITSPLASSSVHESTRRLRRVFTAVRFVTASSTWQ